MDIQAVASRLRQPFTGGCGECVDDFDNAVSTGPRTVPARTLRTPCTGSKRSHNAHCVTLEPRRRYNMSSRGPDSGCWHGRCFYLNQKRPTQRPREGSDRASGSKRKRGYECSGWKAHRHRVLNITTRRHSSTHKQATDTPRRAGFFLPARRPFAIPALALARRLGPSVFPPAPNGARTACCPHPLVRAA
jgi:hypothetical protein